MRFLEFNLLPEKRKMRELWERGILVAEREDGNYRYELFQLEDFYAEQTSSITYNLRKPLKTFKSVCLLDPYLVNIDLSTLLIILK